MAIVRKEGYELSNVDATIALQVPKVNPYVPEMKSVLANICLCIIRVSQFLVPFMPSKTSEVFSLFENIRFSLLKECLFSLMNFVISSTFSFSNSHPLVAFPISIPIFDACWIKGT